MREAIKNKNVSAINETTGEWASESPPLDSLSPCAKGRAETRTGAGRVGKGERARVQKLADSRGENS